MNFVLTNLNPTVVAATIGAMVTLVLFLLTKIIELINEFNKQKVKLKSDLMALKTELALNLDICNRILSTAGSPRTSGFDFIDTSWNACDKYAISNKKVPWILIYDAYSKMLIYNLLKKRRKEIQSGANYPNAQIAINNEREEMLNLLDKLKDILQEIANHSKEW